MSANVHESEQVERAVNAVLGDSEPGPGAAPLLESSVSVHRCAIVLHFAPGKLTGPIGGPGWLFEASSWESTTSGKVFIFAPLLSSPTKRS